MDVTLKESFHDAWDGGVGGEEGGEQSDSQDLGDRSVEVRAVATTAVAEGLAYLMKIPDVFSLHGVDVLPAQGLLHEQGVKLLQLALCTVVPAGK